MKKIYSLVAIALLFSVRLSATQILVVRSVDVVVVGGSSAAVTAAIAAKNSGAEVFLIAPRPYLGEDIAGTLRVMRDKADDSRSLVFRSMFANSDKKSNELTDRITPLQAKKVLDKALLDNNIPYLTGAIACDVVTDENGVFAGVVMANRSGRQVVRAKVLIDATSRARMARLAGGETLQFPEGTYKFKRIVLSGEEPKGEGVKAKALTEPSKVSVKNRIRHNNPSTIDARFWECEIDIKMKDGSARSFAEAEQIARDRTFTSMQLDAANTMTLIAPDKFISQASVKEWTGVDALDLKCLQPKGTKGVWVLGPLADIDRNIISSFMMPGSYMMIGERVGGAAATEAKALPKVNGKLTGALKGESIQGTLGEHHMDLPGYIVTEDETINIDDKLPIIAKCDTLVVGAGTGGGPAGIASARQGSKTLVCEYLYIEGGVSTEGRIGYYWFGNCVGFTKEIDNGVKSIGKVFPQSKSEWYRSEQRKAGAEIWFGSFVNGVIVSDGAVVGAVVVFDDGTRGLVTCKNAIDATGNAELPAMAGEETEFITDDELSVQGVGHARQTLGDEYANSDIGFVDDSDAADIFYFALRSRLSLPGGTWDQAQNINSRERRRMIGAFYMSAQDVVCERTYPDVIARTFSNFDSHGQTRDDMFFIQDPGHKPMYVNLPYRCFLPKKLEGLLVVGLGISAHRDAMPILRMQPDIQNQGYVAGTACAMALKGGTTVREIDIKALQNHLVEKKILRKEDLNLKDSFPLSDEAFDVATKELADGYKGLPTLMTDRKRAIPRLKVALEKAEGEAKVIYAHVLAMMGDASGEAELLAKFSSMDWDKGWNYRGMGQFNRSVSWADSYAIALGHCKSKAAVPALIEKASKLTAKSTYSHFRSIALALEEIGDKAGVQALADILKQPGIAGQYQVMSSKIPTISKYSNTEADWERTLSLRELCVARALYRLGDTADGLARKTLEAYARDPRRTYAKHAKKVLLK